MPEPLAPLTASRPRRLLVQLLAALIVISAVQVGWWLYDQARFARDIEQRIEAIVADGAAQGAAQLAEVRELNEHRAVRYAWEGAFFLLVLLACIAVILRGLRAEFTARRRQETFLALVSHQFKTPLASLRLAVETITLRRTAPEHTERLAARALDDVQRLEDLVTNILESARLDEGRVQLRRERLPLARSVAQTIDRLAERAGRLGITLTADVPPDLYALADPMAADAVLRNLLDNAIASVAPLGGGTITVSARTAGQQIELEVRDSGVGFDPADSRALFEKFGFSELNYRGGERTGLGLYIVQRLMALGGGSVRAESDGLGRGARFTLLWPRAAEEAS